MLQTDRIFKESFYENSPEFMVVDCGIFAQEVAIPTLHTGKNRSCNFREVFEFFFKMFVFFSFCNESNISQGMPHFMQAYITVGSLTGDAFDKIIPGKINSTLIHVTHKRA